MPPLNSMTRTTLAIALSQAIALPAHAATLTVNSLADDTTGNNSQCTLRESIVSINTGILNPDCGDTAPGNNDAIVFAESISADHTISLVNGQLELSGDMSITAPVEKSGAYTVGRLTVLQTTAGQRVLSVYNGNNQAGPNVSLNGLEISGGDSGSAGGGILAKFSANLTISDSRISNNSATFGGGIALQNSAMLTLSDSSIRANSSTNNAGGIGLNIGSSATLTNSYISGNNAANSGGGAVVLNSSTIELRDTSLDFNYAEASGGCVAGFTYSTINLDNSNLVYCSAESSGGGIFAEDATLIIRGSSILDSSATMQSGGGIFASATSQVAISDSVVSSNFSGGNGAGIAILAPATAVLDRSSLSNNFTNAFGGGVYTVGRVDVHNSTINSNIATYGGGLLANNGGTINLSNATVSRNRATTNGGGVFAYINSNVNFSNTIVSYNRSDGGAKEIYIESTASSSSIGVNIFGSGENSSAAAFTGFTPAVPNIVATSDGNQPTLVGNILNSVTRAPNFTEFFPLSSDSPAIGVADTTECESKDQRGRAREDALVVPIVVSENKVAVINLGGECDIGAVEFDEAALPEF